MYPYTASCNGGQPLSQWTNSFQTMTQQNWQQNRQSVRQMNQTPYPVPPHQQFQMYQQHHSATPLQGMQALSSPQQMQALSSPPQMQTLSSPTGMQTLSSPPGMQTIASPPGMQTIASSPVSQHTKISRPPLMTIRSNQQQQIQQQHFTNTNEMITSNAYQNFPTHTYNPFNQGQPMNVLNVHQNRPQVTPKGPTKVKKRSRGRPKKGMELNRSNDTILRNMLESQNVASAVGNLASFTMGQSAPNSSVNSVQPVLHVIQPEADVNSAHIDIWHEQDLAESQKGSPIALAPSETFSVTVASETNTEKTDDDDDILIVSVTLPSTRAATSTEYRPIKREFLNGEVSLAQVSEVVTEDEAVRTNPLLIVEEHDTDHLGYDVPSDNMADIIAVCGEAGGQSANLVSTDGFQTYDHEASSKLIDERRKILNDVQERKKTLQKKIEDEDTLSYSDSDFDSMGLSPANPQDLEDPDELSPKPLDLCVDKIKIEHNQEYPIDFSKKYEDVYVVDDEDEDGIYSPITPPNTPPNTPPLVSEDQAIQQQSLYYCMQMSKRRSLESVEDRDSRDSGRESATPGFEHFSMRYAPPEEEDVSQMLAMEWLSNNSGVT